MPVIQEGICRLPPDPDHGMPFPAGDEGAGVSSPAAEGARKFDSRRPLHPRRRPGGYCFGGMTGRALMSASGSTSKCEKL